MCAFTPAVLAGLNIAGTALSFVGQQRMANAQHRQLQSNLNERAEQRNDAAQQSAWERSRAARAERARLLALAGESNVTGASVGLQLLDSAQQESMDRETIEANRNNALRADQTAAQAQAANIQRPNALLAGLQIGQTLYDYNQED